MDFATIIGLLVAFGAIGSGFVLEGGDINSVFIFAPMMIVFGGTLGATTITTSIQTVFEVPTFLRIAFFSKARSIVHTIDLLYALSEKARREGILGLEANLKSISDPFFRNAVQMVVDGTEVTVLREILEIEIAYIEERHRKGINFFQKAGGFSPTMGILGTVLGLIKALGDTSDASKMAAAIAAAFIATLWGVGMANLFFLPVADKLRMRHEEEIAYYELIMEGIIALQSGENPRNIRVRLQSFIPPHHR